MYSTRKDGAKVLVLAVAGALTGAAGCQRIVPPPVKSAVNNTPLVVDEAMQIREHDRTTAYYANGSTIAGGTGYLWQTHEAVKPEHRRWTDAPVATANIVAMPVGVLVNSPFKAQVIKGETVPPSYTAQPPLPGKSSTGPGSGAEVMDTPAPEGTPPLQETVPPPPDGAQPPPTAPPVETTPPAPAPSNGTTIEVVPSTTPATPAAPAPGTTIEITPTPPPAPPAPAVEPAPTAPVTPAPDALTPPPPAEPPAAAPVPPVATELPPAAPVPPVAPPAPVPPEPAPVTPVTPPVPATAPLNK